MNGPTEVESTGDNEKPPAHRTLNPRAVGGALGIQRSGGSFVGLAGRLSRVLLFTRKLSSFAFPGIAWMIFGAIVWTVVDEFVRSAVRSVLGESPPVVLAEDESRKFPLLETDAYQGLPTNWRQLLAEVQINQSNYPARLVSMVRELTLDDIAILSQIAPYVIGNAIVYADDFEMGYEIPSVDDMDFERLKTIGITSEGKFGMYADVKPEDGKPVQRLFTGETLALAVESRDATTELRIHLISLTEEGSQIVGLLDEPTSVEGMCTIASQLKKRKAIDASIFAAFEGEEEGDAGPDREWVANASGLCSHYGVTLSD